MNSAHDPSSCRGRTRSSASSAITASPHIRVGFDASLIRSFSPLNGISLARGPRYARISICIGEALARARAFYVVPPSVPLANRAPSHPSLRKTSNTPSHSSPLLLLPHASSSCSYFALFIPSSTSTFDRGDYPGLLLSTIPYSYRAFEIRSF